MCNFLLLETSTEECSAALVSGRNIISIRETHEPKAHARLLASFIESILKETGISLGECCAVSVSEGPGSYTGLRVGVSTAKGLCYGADLPLIGVGTLDILAYMAISKTVPEDSIIIPMIDARRMEVYCATFNPSGDKITDTRALVLDSNSFSDEFTKYQSLIFIGDGVEKFQQCLNPAQLTKSTFIQCSPSVEGMVHPTLQAWKKKEFKDRAYFEPFYLKDFVAGVSKKSIF